MLIIIKGVPIKVIIDGKMDQIKCYHSEPPAVMDCCAVFIFLCLLSAEAACGPVRKGTKSGALNATVQLMREEIQTILDHLAAPGLLPNIPCLSLNTTELVGPEQQLFTSHHLSSFRCHMRKMSELTPELSPQLLITSQHTQGLERLTSGQAVQRDCSLPTFEQDMESYVYVKCILELLDQQLSSAKF